METRSTLWNATFSFPRRRSVDGAVQNYGYSTIMIVEQPLGDPLPIGCEAALSFVLDSEGREIGEFTHPKTGEKVRYFTGRQYPRVVGKQDRGTDL